MGSVPSDTLSLSEDTGIAIPEPTQTLHQILIHSARQHPEKTALVSCHQPRSLLPSQGFAKNTESRDYLRWSYAHLEKASGLLASYFIQSGVGKGDAVVVITYSCAEWALCFWAAARLGCPFVPINPAIVARANEIQHVLSALGRIGALVVNDDSIVKLLSGHAPAEIRKSSTNLILGGVGMIGWTAFEDTLSTPGLSGPPMAKQSMDDTVLIVLTSGTTALPKGCPHTNKTVASMCARHKIMYSLDETRVSCNHMPLFHLAGVMESLWAWAHGGTVVYPNHSFDARATLDAIDREKCTDMCLVPSMLRAMIDHPALSSGNTKSLGLIKLAANDVLGSDARACSEILQARLVTNCFGMTETSGMTEIFAWKDGICKDFEPFPVGRMAAGAKARICTPGSRTLVERGVIGELHQGGMTVTDRYIGGGEDDSSFYTDPAGSWHISGDRAVMSQTGEISVLGRYKDIINRAGENISPSVMERVLNAIQGVNSSQVVGVPDEVAGEVPVAVIKLNKDSMTPKNVFYDRILKELGVIFSLDKVLYLKELGAEDWPTTATGKVRKVDVRRMVIKHLRHESQSSTRMAARESTEAALTRIWARFSGVPEQQISSTMSLEGMVDSVTIMRFRSQVKKELGKTFSLEELNQNPTIAKQAVILDRQQENLSRGNEASSQPVREGPPQLSDIVHSRGKQDVFDEIRRDTENQLQTIGLSWDEDVEEVLPMYDYVVAWRVITGSISFRIVFKCFNTTTEQLRSAMETVLPRHGMLRTILVYSASAGFSWAMIRSSKHWFDLSIVDGGNLKNPEDLLSIDMRSPELNNSKPLPLFYIKLYFVEATQSAGFVVYGDYSTFDAHSVLSLFVEDLRDVLENQTATLAPRPQYSLFANAYYNYRTSIPAQLMVDYHTSRFAGLSNRPPAFWPKETFQSVNAPPERSADQLLLEGNIAPGLTGLTKHIPIDMRNNVYLKMHKIPHSVAIKAAIAIYNTQQTGHPYAFFSNLQMCRSYPFLPSEITSRLPDIMDMPGATLEGSFEEIHLPPSEPLCTFLPRLHAQQNELTAHAQYPSLRMLELVDPADREFMTQASRRQAINYNPVVKQDEDAKVQNMQFAGSANLSIIWWCGMVDAETVQIRVTWCDEVFGMGDAERAVEGFERNLKWIVEGGNWERGVGECGI
ncbi:MAG: hypothetical protein HETSPECPRED_005266 [Heterodermia speciosa]|uniref:Carrier domain-containing protein n=1 Tax=Heterodermia speciosa TaxID=116794 RepID=A0A8H3FBZ3_9LECA|nr:MAG: hypothetical protein HETSPECPRED_005266 [Heterodermia speciosa]